MTAEIARFLNIADADSNALTDVTSHYFCTSHLDDQDFEKVEDEQPGLSSTAMYVQVSFTQVCVYLLSQILLTT